MSVAFFPLNGPIVRTAFLGTLGLGAAACGETDPSSPMDHFLKSLPVSSPASPDPNLRSDVTVSEIYRLSDSPGVQGVMALFHASWCEPCKIVETPDYQRAIKEFNEAQSEIRVVTLRVDDAEDPLIDPFWDIVGPVPIQVTHIKTGQKEIVEDSVIPSALLVYFPSRKYARSMKIPPSPDTVEPWARRGFRYPEKFEKSFPRIEELNPK